MDSVAHFGYSNNHNNGVSRLIDLYTPRGIDRWAWQEVRQTVTDIVRASQPISEDDARARLGAVTRLTLWCHSELGYDLEPTLILHPASVERFISVTMVGVSAPTQRREAQRLHAVSAAFHGTTRASSKRVSHIARSSVYSTKEKIGIVAWAESQTSERLRANADILNALTLGAGLYPAEILATRVGNIVDLSGILVVNVLGDNPRQVPVRQFWADTLRERLAGRPSDASVIDCQANPASTTSIMVLFHGTTRANRPDPQKMRSSWIVGLLNDRVPLPLVLNVAGLKHSHSLNRYLPFVEPVADGYSLMAGSEASL